MRFKRRYIVIAGCLMFLIFVLSDHFPGFLHDKIVWLDKEIYEQRLREIETVFPRVLRGNYILNNPDLCSGTDNLVVLVMVHTAPGHFERRQNIRSTYGSSDLFENKLRVLFLLGTVENEFLRDAIIQEHKTCKDTIQGNFIDSYQNLTYKGVMGFRWITEYCSHVKYVMKIDDDIVIDMWRYMHFLENRNHIKSIFCPFVSDPLIERYGKWKVYTDEFKGMSYWSFDYCPGFMVVLTVDVIKPLFETVQTSNFFWIDDVYLFGILPHKAGNIAHIKLPLRLKVTPNKNGEECLVKNGTGCEYAAVGLGFVENNFHLFWNIFKKRRETSTNSQQHYKVN